MSKTNRVLLASALREIRHEIEISRRLARQAVLASERDDWHEARASALAEAIERISRAVST